MVAFPHFNARAHNNGSLSTTYGFIGHRYSPTRFIPQPHQQPDALQRRMQIRFEARAALGLLSSNDQPFQVTRHHREQKPKERRIKGSAAVGSGSMP
jgi:hypothetical protein